ncbi:RagB/SusD family nutrient uptake outer membrane protein [uncultured Parabacteroides sp.]|uniref:RagB/SusD family nutrient uptake outer membrane protein n=1 Tax=uncultured Parabacteroides sp. TaxID=512312 RepID=UPI002602DE5B|nr:RagB/SusD family nutrient uptake outer membrane protein [uncultured Parabacteroides sp.]
MKKIIKFSCISLFALFNTHCSFLDEKPVDRLVEDNFYASEQDAQAAVDAAYQQLNGIYNRCMYMLCDLTCDGMKNGLGMPNSNLQDLEFLRHTSENTFISDMWQNNYAGIMKANAAINNIPSITMNPELQQRLIGEAKFLRALYYFNLVRFWGDVPLVTRLETIDDAMGPRVAKEQIFEQILSDLAEAEEILPYPSEYTSADIGRVTKGAAKILAGKVYLTKGDFANAKDKLAEVVEHESSYGYGLHVNYGDNWNLETEAGKEAVFYIEYKANPFPNNGEMSMVGPKYSIPETVGVQGSNEADIPTMELNDAFEENDKRKNVNMRTHYTNFQNGKELVSSIPLFGKYWQEGISAAKFCEINMHIIRYSDALLMYAEALNEVGESAKAHEVLNRVRERAFGDSSGNYSGLSKDEFRQVILKERFLEFPIEGHRWFDLVRMGVFVTRMKEHSAYEASIAENNKTDIAKNIKDHMVLMPIPQRELDLNPELNQNPGW